MHKLRVAYFNKLGLKEIEQAKQQFLRQYPNLEVKLISTGHQRAFALLQADKVDLAVNDWRADSVSFHQCHLATYGLMAVLQKGTYPIGVQTIAEDQLRDMTCFLICSPAEENEEKSRYHDYWHLSSPTMAVTNVDEASVLVSSGSGYFISNEKNVRLLNNDTLQHLFLLNHGRQMTTEYRLFWQKERPLLSSFITLLKQIYRQT